MGQRDTHPTLFLLLFTLSFLLLLVLPIEQMIIQTDRQKKCNLNLLTDASVEPVLTSVHFLQLLPTFVARFERPSPCPFCPSALPPWPLGLSSPFPDAGAPRLLCAAPPGDVSPLLSKHQTGRLGQRWFGILQILLSLKWLDFTIVYLRKLQSNERHFLGVFVTVKVMSQNCKQRTKLQQCFR